MIFYRHFQAVLSVLAILLLSDLAGAQELHNFKDPLDPLAGWRARIDSIKASLNRSGLEDVELVRRREELVKIQSDAYLLVQRLDPRLKDAQNQLSKLGPAPKDGESAETEEVAAQRQQLDRKVSEISGTKKTAALLSVRAGQVADQIQERRRTLFYDQILTRWKSPFSPSLWKVVLADAATGFSRLGLLLREWWRGLSNPSVLPLILALGIAVWFAFKRLANRWIVRHRSYAQDGVPPFFKQARSSAWVAIARAAPLSAAALFIYAGMAVMNMLPPRIDTLVQTGFTAFIAVVAISALAITLLAPNRARWRLIPASNHAARRLSLLAIAIAGVYGADLFLNKLNSVLFAPLSLTVLQSVVFTLLFAGLLVGVLNTRLGATGKQGAAPKRSWLSWLRMPIWVLIIAVLIAAGLGYVPLARFITQQVVLTGSILVLAYLIHLSIGELPGTLANAGGPTGLFLQTTLGLEANRRHQIGAVFSALMHLVLALLILPLIVLQWGFNWDDVKVWTGKALFGFQIGGLYISLIDILIALGLFLLGIVVTRLFQRWLDRRILTHSHSDTGAAHSIKLAVGYLGLALSALIAISYTGLSFSNLAIVAGALSVGIGFGLQSIVNNFVSGLILLAERPIKVGDWIVVGSDEGYVRRISVRSTEIETFDRAHIVVPNSQLISGTVKNWTLRNPLGRVVIPIGVAYGTDPEQVRAILLQAAASQPEVLDFPEPVVFFEDFGASSLDFSLRAYLANINMAGRVRSDLRFAILKAFREADIEIPFPQRDINLRDMDRLERALAGREPEIGSNAETQPESAFADPPPEQTS